MILVWPAPPAADESVLFRASPVGQCSSPQPATRSRPPIEEWRPRHPTVVVMGATGSRTRYIKPQAPHYRIISRATGCIRTGTSTTAIVRGAFQVGRRIIRPRVSEHGSYHLPQRATTAPLSSTLPFPIVLPRQAGRASTSLRGTRTSTYLRWKIFRVSREILYRLEHVEMRSDCTARTPLGNACG